MNLRQRQELEARRIWDAQQRLLLHNRAPKTTTQPFDILGLVEPYRDYFLADARAFKPKTKSGSDEKRLLELVRYLFCKYRVGAQLIQVWLRKLPSNAPMRWGQREKAAATTIPEDPVLWFICVAQGGSLYKVHSKQYLTKMETHVLVNCPYELSFEQTLVFATAKTFASSDGSALRLAHSKLSTLQFNAFLKTVIYFFAKNPPNSLDEVNDLTDFIMARYQESRGTWSLTGRTLESLRQRCKDWHYELRRIKAMGTFNWEGAPIPDEMIQTGSKQQPLRWHFNQIKSSKVLAEEGTKMRHCVYGYRQRCISGDTYIWSLSREEYGLPTRKVTIELSNNGDIVQARGLANRAMRLEERHAVQLWAGKNHLRLVC
jgi:hypothetical protein